MNFKLIPIFLVVTSFLLAEATAPESTSSPVFDPHALKNSCRMWTDGEVLFWQSSVDNLSYGIESQSTNSLQKADVKSPSAGWDWGFRLGVGYKIPHDAWDLLLTYTQVNAHTSDFASPKEDVIFPSWGGAFVDGSAPWYVDKATVHWKAHVHVVDLEVGRFTQVGKYLSLRPLLGIRSLFIKQHYHIAYQGGNFLPIGSSDAIRSQQDFWGVGLRLGVDSLWALGRGWGVYGNGSLSLLSGHTHGQQKEKQKPVNLLGIEWRQDVDPLVMVADLAFGVQWDYLFSKDRYHLGVKFGWEFNVFFDQNQQVRWVGESLPGFVINEHGDLAFQGVALGFRFDF